MKLYITNLLLFFSTICFAQNSEVINNETIIKLHKIGLSKEVLKSKIQSSSCNFNMSTENLIILKKAGIPDEVIETMLTKGNSINPSMGQNKNNEIATIKNLSSGIYFFDSTTNKYMEFYPSVLTNLKAGGLGEVLKRSVSGLFNSKQRASLSGAESNTKIYSNKPTFLFVFDTTSGGFNNSNSIWSNVQSPNEFFLIKLTVVKNSREVVVGKENNINVNVGIDDSFKVPFVAKNIKKGVYEVTPASSMAIGEFCFMFASSSMYSGLTHKVYDFSIKH